MRTEYRIEKERVPVTFVTADGNRFDGDMFVHPYARHRFGPEEPIDVLNGEDPFIPLGQGDDVLVVAKRNISEVVVPAVDGQVEAGSGARASHVEVRLLGGEVRVGRMFLDVAEEWPRLIDYLNRSEDQFLMLHVEGGTRLLSRRCIAVVRPVG